MIQLHILVYSGKKPHRMTVSVQRERVIRVVLVSVLVVTVVS